MGIKRDVPVILNNIAYEDDYQGDFASRRAIIYTLSFTAKFYLYGPVTSSKVIKTVQVDQYTDMPDQSPKREQRYSVTPNPTTQMLMMILVSVKQFHSSKMQKISNPETGSDKGDIADVPLSVIDDLINFEEEYKFFSENLKIIWDIEKKSTYCL